MGQAGEKNKPLFSFPRMNNSKIHLKCGKMKQKKFGVLGLLLFILSACQWEEELTLAELYAGTYKGKLEILTDEREMVAEGQVDMVVAGDRGLHLKFINLDLGCGTIDTLMIPVLLSLHEQNRLAGKRDRIGLPTGQQMDVAIDGNVFYGKSELTTYINMGIGESASAIPWVVKFQGTRK